MPNIAEATAHQGATLSDTLLSDPTNHTQPLPLSKST